MSKPQLNTIYNEDCLETMKRMPDNFVDLIVTDPPYGYSFMGKDWDKAVPSVDIWKECLRVLKPGAFCFVMSAPRSDVQNAMISRLMEAGFRLDFTPIYWTYASGFPKAGNIGKLVDKRNGTYVEGEPTANARFHSGGDDGNYNHAKVTREFSAQSDQAKALDGSYAGYQPKPAVEVIIVAMKPLSEKTYVDQAMKNGKGITWLDDVRVPTEKPIETGRNGRCDKATFQASDLNSSPQEYQSQGRFPANLLISDSILDTICTCTPEVNTQTQEQDLLKELVGTKESLKQTEITSLTENLEAKKQNERSQKPLEESGSLQNTKLLSQPQESQNMTASGASQLELPTATELTEFGWKQSEKETTTPAYSVGQPKTSTLTTSNHGQHTQNSDSTQITGEYCALHATGKRQRGALKPSDNYSRYFDLDKWASTLPFLIVPKASKREKNEGLEHIEPKYGMLSNSQKAQLKRGEEVQDNLNHASKSHNSHPTVKPLKLMSYLITLGSRKGDTVLDPFVGSGTTAVAAKILGRIPIGIEREAEYAEIAQARLDNAVEFVPAEDKQTSLLEIRSKYDS